MYFAYGWPRVAIADLPPNDSYIYLRATEKYLFAVSRTCVQLWNGGLYRIKLSECVRTEEDVKQEGLHMAAVWSPVKATLAILTSENYLNLYAIHLWKDNLLHSSCNVALKDIQKADIYLKSSIRMDSETRALSITGDSRLLLVGFADGTVASLSWSGKMKEVAYPLDAATELGFAGDAGGSLAEDRKSSASVQPDSHKTATEAVEATTDAGRSSGGGSNSVFATAAGTGLAHSPSLPISRAIVQMSYCEHSKQVIMVLADGGCAVCSTSDSGLSPLPEMCFGRWLCGPQHQAVCAQVSARAQLIAVGRDNGDVDLFRLTRTTIGPAARSEGGDTGSRSIPTEAPWEVPVRTLSLENWGHRPLQTGPVAQVEWSPDGRALAVGYAGQGVVVWSPSGCRLMCSLRQPPPGLSTYPSANSRGLISHQTSLARGPSWGYQRGLSSNVGSQPQVPLDGSVSALCWGPMGYQLEVAEVGGGAAIAGAGGGLTQVTFAHSLHSNHRVARGGIGTSLADEEVHVLQAHDRLLLIREVGEAAMGVMPWASGDASEPAMGQVGDLTVSHVPVPHSYVAANWPLQRSAISASGADIAVAGRNGLAVYNRPTERWRLFGDISQERQVSCRALGWLSSGVLVACSGPDPYAPPAPSPPAVGGLVVGGGGAAGASGVTGNELLLLPRYHLDLVSLLARYPLQQPPIAMDCLGSHILLASEPLEITLLEVSLHGELSPTGTPKATITTLREISMFDVGRYLSDVALVPLSPGAVGVAAAAAAAATSSGSTVVASTVTAPRQCVLLRWGGMISVLDLEKGSELALATEIEAFWLSDPITCQTGPFSDSMGGAPAALPGHSIASSMGRASGTASSNSSFSVPAHGTVETGRGQVPGTVEAWGGMASDAALAGPVPRQPDAYGSFSSTSTLDVEMPWWLYGPVGMQLCFPSSLGTAAALSMAYKEGHDIELEFDQEVYPVGISLADDAIVGITQRIVRGTGGPITGPNGVLMASAAQLPCFHPIPESQPVLPCLLRRLLQRGAFQEAVSLARRHARGPHFARSLEWLLFTALEIETNTSSLSRPVASAGKRVFGTTAALDTAEASASAHQSSSKQPLHQQSLLAAAANLVRHFPNLFAEVVVSVARKTDAALWPPLFDAVGSPSKLLDGLVDAGELASAACFLLIIDRLEGAAAAQQQALRLMRSSLLRGQYPLCCELLRFVVPPADQDTDSGRLMSLELAPPVDSAAAASSAPGLAEQQQHEPPAAIGQPTEKPFSLVAEESTSQSGGGGGGRTWLGWLLGYSADPDPFPSEPQTDTTKQQQSQAQRQDTESLTVARDSAGAAMAASTAARPSLNETRMQQALQAASGRVSLPSNGPTLAGSPALAQMLMSISGDAASVANAKAACGLVAEHAWRLLESGCLAALGQLFQASSFLPGGLAGLMKQHRHSPYASHGCTICAGQDLLKCLARAVSELPVWSSEAVEMCAVDVERLCREVGAVAWAVAMAVVLVDAASVTAFKQEQPEGWADFVQLLHGDSALSYLWDIVEVLTDGVGNAAKGAEQGQGDQGPGAATGALGIVGWDQNHEEGGEGGSKTVAAAGTMAAAYTVSGVVAANVGHVEVRPLSIVRPNSEIEEFSQQGTPTAAIPGPRAGEVSISRA